MSGEELDALIARVEDATGPDREIDAELARLMNWVPTGVNASLWNVADPKPEYWYSSAFGLPPYTASIDAALALVERVKAGEELGWWVTILEIALREIAWKHTLEGPKPGPAALARAIILALLRALKAQP